jgi:hypothetical protein
MRDFERLLEALCFAAHSLPCSITFCPTWALYCALLEEARMAGTTSLSLPPDLTQTAAVRSEEAQGALEDVVEDFLKEFPNVSRF